MTPEYIIEICAAIDIAILGIAYPIIIDKISNIGDKYSSEYIPVVFSNEFPQKSYKFTCRISVFKLTLFATLFSFIFLIFKIPPTFGWDNWFINNSAKLAVFVLTVLLIGVTGINKYSKNGNASAVKIYGRITFFRKRRNNWFIIKKKTVNLQQYSGNKEIHIKN